MRADKSSRAGKWSVPTFTDLQIFALIFSAIFLLHLPLLRLPYFWDEAGYYIPAAYDFFLHGHLIPQAVPSNAHPPVPAVYLALWWKLSAFKPAVTRIAMLLIAALALTAVFKLSGMLTNAGVALAVAVCSALFPIWFAQSSLAHADLPAAAFVLYGLFFYFRSFVCRPDRRGLRPILVQERKTGTVQQETALNLLLSAALFALAGLSKETAVITPVTLAAYDLWSAFSQRKWKRSFLLRPVLLLASTVPLALWFLYHRQQTGYFFGNPEFFAYNVSGTVSPVRFVLSFVTRLWQMLGYMNLWLLTIATLWVMRYPALSESDGSERSRIDLRVQYRILAIVVVHAVVFSLIGGAVLARYLLPAYPLIILIGVSTLRRRLQEWKWAVVVIAAGFILALFSNPWGYIPPEDNLSYRNYVILHKQAADYLQQHHPAARVLTAWSATDELTKPFLGYVHKPMRVVRIDNFSYDQLQLARAAEPEFDVALLFPTKQQPSASLLDRWPWWEKMSSTYFGFHRDLPPQVAAETLGGTIGWERRRGEQWVAVADFDRVENASRSGNPP